MAWFLAKTDPETYSVDQFADEGSTIWDGVTNPQAVQVIRGMKPRDKVLLYHSGGEAAIVGLAQVLSEARPDPANAKSWVVDMKFVQRIEPPVTLKEIKASDLFGDWALVRQGRLSTMTVPEAFLDWVNSRNPKLRL